MKLSGESPNLKGNKSGRKEPKTEKGCENQNAS